MILPSILVALLGVICLRTNVIANEEEARAAAFLAATEAEGAARANQVVLSEWAYATNITESTQRAKIAISKEYAKYQKESWRLQQQYHWQEFKNETLRRRFQLGSVLGSAALSDDDYAEYEESVSSMQSAWNRARICDFHQPEKCDVPLRPDIYELLATSRNEAELKHVWVQFRQATGNTTRPQFENYVRLINKAARANNFSNAAEMWLHSYEADDFRDQVTALWQQIKPLYLQLHAYVRRHLRERYGDNVVRSRGPIPAHLLVAEEYFTSLGLSEMPETFWNRSELVKPTDGREFECQASAWDFYDAQDFRIKQCTTVTQDEFYTVHHEMGHVQYFLQYKHQPIAFRSGANPGFHEAVGDVISLSVSTAKHLRAVGLLDEAINHLFLVALDKIAFIPSALMMDEWRWDVFEGRAQPEEYNCHWWKLRELYQGVEPTVDRSEEDFDPGSKYFVSYIIQFQFHRSLCNAAGQHGPLHECDIYRSTEAGELLGRMLQLGASKPWPDAMEIVTGQRHMDATAVREYFAPLETWLAAENERTGEYLGWEATEKRCVQTKEELIHI
ncbi:hypothetical protein B566_EDAN004924 [Ephemera danica]|nr:hypothetical protein B566_EDAN004924 [Ephemera danica]